MKIRNASTDLHEIKIIEPEVFEDNRGFFLEVFNQKRYQEEFLGDISFVQDNQSFSSKNVLRGLHFQKKRPQGKLVWVNYGSVLDVAVDIRHGSDTFGMYHSEILSSENKKQMWRPPGFAHGFLALSDYTNFAYKCSDYYAPEDEQTIIWNDPDLNIEWQIKNPIVSEKDKMGCFLKNI